MTAAPRLVDTHAHPMDPALANDVAGLLSRAAEAGVSAIVCVGYDLVSSREAIRLAERESMCFAAVGIHPNYVQDAHDEDLKRLEELASAPRVVAIGETGLDYYRDFSSPEAQRSWFQAHLGLAQRLRLPVIVHNRQADHDTLSMLGRWRASVESTSPPGVLHCFSGDVELLRQAEAIDFMISFAGTVTFRNASAVTESARVCSEQRYVIETDCPYLSPHPHRGQRNEPARVRLVAERLAELRQVPLEVVARQTTRNAVRLFPGLATAVSGEGAGA